MDEQIKAIVDRIRNLRELFDVNEEEMAKEAGVSLEMYKKLEAGEEDFSFSVLFNIARRFNIDITVLLTGEDPRLQACSIVRRDKGLSFARRKEYKYKHLAYSFKEKKMEPFLVTVEYEGDSEENPKVPNTHSGHEFNYIIEGRVRLFVDGHKYDLNEGDSAYYDAGRPHHMYALDGKRARFLSVISEN